MAFWNRGGVAVGSLALALLVVEPCGQNAIAETPEEPKREAAETEPTAVDSAVESANEPLPVSRQEADLGWTFRSLAGEFGLRQYVAAKKTETGLLFEYLPEDERLEDWRTLGTLLLVPVGSSWSEGEDVLPRYVDAFRRRQKKVNDIATWPGSGGNIWFMDYVVFAEERGPDQHNLAAVWQLLPGTLAIFQTQRRAARFEPWQVDHFRRVAARLGRASEPEAPSPEAEPVP